MKFLHTMIRVSDLTVSLNFFCNLLGLKELRRRDSDKGKFTLVFLYAPKNPESHIELTYNWDQKEYTCGSNFGHLAFEVDNIYDLCATLIDEKVVINRPPRDGRMAFIRSPDGISIELLQKGDPLPLQKPWSIMENYGDW